MWDKIVRNALSNVTGTAVSLAVGFVTMPLVVAYLGPTAFGLWVLATGVVGYMGLLDFGLAPTLVKKSAELLARDDDAGRGALSETVSTIYGLYAVLGLLGTVALVSVAGIADALFQVPPDDVVTFRLVLLVVGLQMALGLPLSIWNGLLAGLEAFHLLNGLGIVTNLLRGGLTVGLLWTGHGLLALVVTSFGVSMLGWTLSRWCVRHRLPALRVGVRYFQRARVGEVFRFSGAMLVWALAGWTLHQLDRILIGIAMPVAMLTTYEVGARLSTYSRSVLHSWLAVVMPAASGLAARRETRRLRALFLRGTRYLLASYVGVAATLLAFGWPFIRLWMGAEYGHSFTLMGVLLVGSVVQSQNVVAHVMLPSMNELRIFTRFMLAYALVTATMAALGVASGGLLGLAVGIASAMMVMEGVFLVVVLRRFGVPVGVFVSRCQVPVLRTLAPVALWATTVRLLVPIESWTALVIAVASTLGVFAGSFWVLGATPGERRVLRRRIRTLTVPGVGGPVSREVAC